MTTPRVVCLLPVRNGAADLPGFFASAAGFADAVIALDDGSTDDTAAVLRAQPLVAKLIANSPRADFRGWDDAANRNRLLETAAEFQPEWIISVDADERIPADDAKALREFLATDALPGIAYGFRCYSMIGDLEHALPNPIWVYRLFAFAPGQRFPDQDLHFTPIPVAISRRAYVRTSFRIQHLGGMSPERRLARYEKYRQADPECRFWPDYSSLLKEPGANDVLPWQPRRTGESAFFTSEAIDTVRPQEKDGESKDAPWLGVIVLDDGPLAGVERALRSVEGDPGEVERMLVTPRPEQWGQIDGALVIPCPGNATRGAMRNLGIVRSRARHGLFLDADLSLRPGALEAIARAHRDGFASVTGTIEPDVTGTIAMGAFLHRFGSVRRRRDDTIMDGAPRWNSCARSLASELGGFVENLSGGEEIAFGRTLAARGYLTYRLGNPLLTFQGTTSASFRRSLVGAYARGAARSCFMQQEYRDEGNLLDRELLLDRFIRRLLRQISQAVARGKSQELAPRARTSAVAALLEVASWFGEWAELAKPGNGKLLTLFGRPAGVALVVVMDTSTNPAIALVRFNLRTPALRVAIVPPQLQIPAAGGTWASIGSAVASATAAENGQLSRFAVHDLAGRPFDLAIDDLLLIDGSSLSPRMKRWLARAQTDGRWRDALLNLFGAPLGKKARAALFARRGVRTTFSRRSAWLALMRLRKLAPRDLDVITLPLGNGKLDTEAIELAHSFLEIDSIHRPATKRNRLRLVEWA